MLQRWREKNGDTPKKNLYRNETPKPIVWFVTLPKMVWTCMAKKKPRASTSWLCCAWAIFAIYFLVVLNTNSIKDISFDELSCWTLAALANVLHVCIHCWHGYCVSIKPTTFTTTNKWVNYVFFESNSFIHIALRIRRVIKIRHYERTK